MFSRLYQVFFLSRLAYLLSKGRSGVSVVLGVPTVKREKQSYLMDTLQNLIDGMTTEEANESLIVVFIAEVRTFVPNCPTQINSTATFIADRH